MAENGPAAQAGRPDDQQRQDDAGAAADKSGNDAVDKTADRSPSGQADADRPAPKQPATAKRTRISAAWIALAVAVLVLVVILIFILQNQQQVNVSFFGANGRFPLGVLMLLSAAGGALLVVILSFARMLQLRWLARRDRRTARRSRVR
jgi:uncharacterized integral membrane protein